MILSSKVIKATSKVTKDTEVTSQRMDERYP